MFASPIAKTRATANPTSIPVLQRSALPARPFDSSVVEQAHVLQRSTEATNQLFTQPAGSLTGNERSDQREQEVEGLTREGLVASFDFSKIPVFPSNASAVRQPGPPPAAPLMTANLQRQLAVGRTDDPLEDEADRVAQHLMRMRDPRPRITAVPLQISSKCAACENEEQVLQAKTSRPSEAAAPAVPGIVRDVLCTPGRPLDSLSRAYFEPRFGRDFSHVRLHTDAQAAESARAIQARAYTVGSNVVFGAGEYLPEKESGRKLLAHELTHVVQQSGGDLAIRRDPAPTASPTSDTENAQACSGCKYDPGEKDKSHSANGILDVDVAFVSFYQIQQPDPNAIIIADFGVDSPEVAPSTLAELHNRSWIDNWQRSSDPLEIRGYSDCAGQEAHNAQLRDKRAQSVARLLPKARSRMKSVGPASFSDRIGDPSSKQGRALSRSVIVRNPEAHPLPTPRPQKTPAPPPHGVGIFNGKTVTITKNNQSISCDAVTDSDAPTPPGEYCVRRQGEAQRSGHGHSQWYLLEPQFKTSRSRMHLHPGSHSLGCVTVTDSDCFGTIETVLNSPGVIWKWGYDGYPPGNTDGIKNDIKDVDCVAILTVAD